MRAVYSVKGSAIRMKFEFVRDRFGAKAETAIRAHFRNRQELEPLLDVSWVPFTLYEEINQYIARVHYGGNVASLQEVGAYSADRGLQSIYKSWVRGKAFIDFLRQMTEYYKTFYSAGDLVVSVGEDGQSATLSFRNAPQYSQAELHIATGFFVGSAKVMGLPDVTHEATLRPSGMELKLRWR
jgi:hypothetical protein